MCIIPIYKYKIIINIIKRGIRCRYKFDCAYVVPVPISYLFIRSFSSVNLLIL